MENINIIYILKLKSQFSFFHLKPNLHVLILNLKKMPL